MGQSRYERSHSVRLFLNSLVSETSRIRTYGRRWGSPTVNLSRHLEALAKQGVVEITKGYEGRKPRTSITGRGRKVLATRWECPPNSWRATTQRSREKVAQS
jgi:DNA-binding MarR family transcriptional regulator